MLEFGRFTLRSMQQRPDGRSPDQIRPISFELNIAPHAPAAFSSAWAVPASFAAS